MSLYCLENLIQCLLSVSTIQLIFILGPCSYWARQKAWKEMMKQSRVISPSRKSHGCSQLPLSLAKICMIFKKRNTKAFMPYLFNLSFSVSEQNDLHIVQYIQHFCMTHFHQFWITSINTYWVYWVRMYVKHGSRKSLKYSREKCLSKKKIENPEI